MAVSVKIEGLEQVVKRLTGLQNMRVIAPAMRAGALHVKGKIAEYPPATIANSPSNPRGQWYERGFGVRWNGGGRKTSETLGRKWATSQRDGGLTQVIGNNASYAPYVQSAEQQARWMKAIGWKTDEQVAEAEGPEVVRLVEAEIRRLVG